MNKSKAVQLVIVNGVIALVLIVVYVLFFIHIQNKNVSASETIAEIGLIQEQNKQFQDLTTVVRNIKESQQKLDSFFVQEADIIEFLEAIEVTGEISGTDVSVRSIIEAETESSDISELTLDLTASGSWESMYHLLALLETFPVKATFDRIQLNQSSMNVDDESEEPVREWKAVFDMKVLQLKK